MPRSARIGLISDTHGLLREQAAKALAGVQHIIHAGDIGAPEVLQALRKIAPVTAVRGNNDTAAWARRIPERTHVEIAGVRIYVLHDVKELDLDPASEGYDVVVAGHSHRPAVQEREGVIFVNPGSAGPRRFSLPVAVGFLEVEAGAVRARIHEIL